MDPTTWAAISTFVAIIAAAAALWSATSARRVAAIERRRDLEQRRPDVAVRFDKWIREPNLAVFAIENRSGQRLDHATVKLVDGGHPLAGFENDHNQANRDRQQTFDNLEPGAPKTATFVAVDVHAWPDLKATFLLSMQTGEDKWPPEQAEAELPPLGPRIRFT